MGRALHRVRVADVLYDVRPLFPTDGWQVPPFRGWDGPPRGTGDGQWLPAQDLIQAVGQAVGTRKRRPHACGRRADARTAGSARRPDAVPDRDPGAGQAVRDLAALRLQEEASPVRAGGGRGAGMLRGGVLQPQRGADRALPHHAARRPGESTAVPDAPHRRARVLAVRSSDGRHSSACSTCTRRSASS